MMYYETAASFTGCAPLVLLLLVVILSLLAPTTTAYMCSGGTVGAPITVTDNTVAVQAVCRIQAALTINISGMLSAYRPGAHSPAKCSYFTRHPPWVPVAVRC